MNIILVGMSGSGKSTVAAILTKKLGFKLLDTDAIIVEQHGDIVKIFAEYGEDYFRKIETCIVKSLYSVDNAVIATGGGCLINPQSATVLHANGKIIYLRTETAELIRRLNGDNSRPLLNGDVEKNLKELYDRRAHIYELAADYAVKTDGRTPEEVAEIIMELIK